MTTLGESYSYWARKVHVSPQEHTEEIGKWANFTCWQNSQIFTVTDCYVLDILYFSSTEGILCLLWFPSIQRDLFKSLGNKKSKVWMLTICSHSTPDLYTSNWIEDAERCSLLEGFHRSWTACGKIGSWVVWESLGKRNMLYWVLENRWMDRRSGLWRGSIIGKSMVLFGRKAVCQLV